MPLRPCPHYAEEIEKRSFISTVRPIVHTNPLRNGAFRKSSSNQRNSKTPTLRFRVDGKHFENGAFRKRPSNRRKLKTPALRFSGNILKTELFENDDVEIIMWFHCHNFPQTQIQMTANCCVFKIPQRSVDGALGRQAYFSDRRRRNTKTPNAECTLCLRLVSFIFACESFYPLERTKYNIMLQANMS